MANFEEVKENMEFINGFYPVILIAIDPDYYKESKKHVKKNISRVFKNNFETDSADIKGLFKKNDVVYYKIENIELSEEDKTELEDIQYVVIDENSIIYASDVKDKIKERLVAGIRLLSEDGNMVDVPYELVEENIPDYQRFTSLDNSFAYQEEIKSLMEELSQRYEGEYQEEEHVEYQEEVKDNHQETVLTSDGSVEETQEEPEYQLYKEDQEETKINQDKLQEEVSVKDSKLVTLKTEQKEVTEDFIVNEIFKQIKRNSFSFEMKDVSEDMKLPDEIKNIEGLQPLLNISKSKISNIVSEFNITVSSEREAKINEICNYAMTLLTDEFTRIKKNTSLSESNTYTNEIAELDAIHEDSQKELIEKLNNYKEQLENQYQLGKNAFVQNGVKQLEQEYDDKNMPVLKNKVKDLETELSTDIKNEYEVKKQAIIFEAREEKVNSTEGLISKVLSLLTPKIESFNTQYKETIDELSKVTTEVVQEEVKKAQDQIIKFAESNITNEELNKAKVEKIVAVKTAEFTDLSNVKDQLEKDLEKEKKRNADIENELKRKAEELDSYKNSYTTLLTAKTQNEILALEKVNSSLIDNKEHSIVKSLKNQGGTILLSILIIGSLYTVNTMINKDNVVATPRTEIKTEETNTTETKEDEQIFKAGDKIKTSIDGKVQEVTVTEVNGDLVTVETKDKETVQLLIEK